METINTDVEGEYSPCSYPTYEEWKHRYLSLHTQTKFCSYPTYEEWKPVTNAKINDINAGSYPTYEEWKQNNPDWETRLQNKVLILPMRNGNRYMSKRRC